MLNDLLLLSGNEIPFPECGISIHQPRIKEIAYIGEETFFAGCELMNFSKDNLLEEDRINLENYTNFDILMSMIKGKQAIALKNRVYLELLLTLLFPGHHAIFSSQEIIIISDEDEKQTYTINNKNFDNFKENVNGITAFDKNSNQDTYNPDGDMAKRISEKLKKRHKFLEEQQNKTQTNKIDIISRYISILAVGEQKDINSFMNYTVYQLFDEFKRYELKMSFDYTHQARLAGAKIEKDAEDWMKDIHP